MYIMYHNTLHVLCLVFLGEDDQRSLEEFIGKFLKAVESNLCFEFSNYGKIKELIHGKSYCMYQCVFYWVSTKEHNTFKLV